MSTSCFAALALSIAALLGPAAALSGEPFASGVAKGDLRWELRANLPRCRHPDQARDAWCKKSDADAATEKSGVEGKLLEWALDPATRTVLMAFFSFSDPEVTDGLCQAASNGTRVDLYIDYGTVEAPEVVRLDECPDHPGAGERTTVFPKGKRPLFPEGHLQHIKIVLVSEVDDPIPLARAENPEEVERSSSGRVRFTSGSANLSRFGTSLHFENWLFFDAPATDYLAQLNLCLFDALAATKRLARTKFATRYAACRDDTPVAARDDIEFFVTPHDGSAVAYDAFLEVLESAESQLMLAAHRLTTGLIYNPLIERYSEGIDVGVVVDDDTLRTGVVDGGPALAVSLWDVKADRTLRDANVDVVYMETRAKEEGFLHLHHNKFLIADNVALFQGSGNFTAAAFNLYGQGHYEQFYRIQDKKIVRAYRKLWRKLYRRATPREDHPVGAFPDRPLCELAPGGCD